LEAPKFDGNLYPESYLDWVQAIQRIYELNDYDDETTFKLATLKLKRYASLWYENLKKNRAREAKSKIKTLSKFEKHMDKIF